MDFTSPTYFHSHPNSMEPPLESFSDPLCKLNLKETSEFVKSFPVAENTRRREGVNSVNVAQRRLGSDPAPATPGRPVFGFSPANFPRKSFPSKWDDAEKWLSGSSCHDSPAHPKLKNSINGGTGFERFRVTEEKVSKAVSSIIQSSSSSSSCSSYLRGFNGPSDLLLKDKFTDDAEPTKEAFLFKNSTTETARRSVEHRDFGTEMTPHASSPASRCHTPLKSPSPARHNTPADRSGPLGLARSPSVGVDAIDLAQLRERHLAKLELGAHYGSNWSSREEEDADVSKSLRHFDAENGGYKNAEARAAVWDEEEKTKCCSRYQREEAKIQAWVNLQSAKAEAQSRKLEVKIQKMRSNLEEKLMKRMALVHRKAEELRSSAMQQHSDQMKKATQNQNAHQKRLSTGNYNKTLSLFSSHTTVTASCGCFPCNHNHYWS